MSAVSPAPTAPAPAAAPAPVPAPKRRSRLVLALLAVIVLVVLGVGGYLFLGGAGASPTEADPTEAPDVEGAIVEVGTLTTNLAGPSPRYARVGIALVLDATADPAAVEARVALVKDAAISEIGSSDAAALQTAEGTEALRQGLARRVAELFPDGEVLRVVLTELLVQ